MDKEKNNQAYGHDQIRLEVAIFDDRPLLNVFLEDGSWFPIGTEGVRVVKGSHCHPEVYKRIWGKPLPTLGETEA